MQADGVTQIFAIVEDNTKELIKELSDIRQQKIHEKGQNDSLDSSRFLNKSSIIEDDSCIEDCNFSALADLTAASENIIDSSDYDLIIEDQNGTKVC